jgi:DNA-binding NarL/FixJ family response regulator
MKNVSGVANVASSIVRSNVKEFSTMYRVVCSGLLGSSQREFDDVGSMLAYVKICKGMADAIDVTVLRYRLTGEAKTGETPVLSCQRTIRETPPVWTFTGAGLNPGDIELRIPAGKIMGEWSDSIAWRVIPAGIVGVSVVEERRKIRENARSLITGDYYRGVVPEFSLDNVEDNIVRDLLVDDAKIQASWFQARKTGTGKNRKGRQVRIMGHNTGIGKIVSVSYNPLRSNYYRKHADRFAIRLKGKQSFDSSIVDTAKSIFAIVWLTSRKRYPDAWIAVTTHSRYIGKIQTERAIQARINAGMKYFNSQEWKGREDVETETECVDVVKFIQLLSSYAMARAIQEIVKPHESAIEDDNQLKSSRVEAIIIENRDEFTGFEKQVIRMLSAGMIETEIAEACDCSRRQVRIAKSRIAEILAE